MYVIVANNFEVDYVNFEKIIKALKEWSIIMEWIQYFLVNFSKIELSEKMPKFSPMQLLIFSNF